MIRDSKKLFRTSVIALLFAFIATYAFFVSYNLIFGVKIKKVNIVDGGTYNNSVINISGNAKNAIYLTLNGREISIDKKGQFEETLVLLSGYNRIIIEATDKFGHTDTKNYQLIYKADTNPVPNLQIETTEPKEDTEESAL